MNAVERLWRALADGDWAAARAQFRSHARIEWPHTGEQIDVDEYVARARTRAQRPAASRVVAEGRCVAVEASAGEARCAAFYDLHDGLIVSGVEYWVGEAA